MSRIKWRHCRGVESNGVVADELNQMVPVPGIASNGAVAGKGATSTVKQPLRVTCDLHHKFGEFSYNFF